MDINKLNKRLNEIEAYTDLIKEHVTVLKKELKDSGVSNNSARKGKGKSVLSEEHVKSILAKRNKQRMKRPRNE